MTLTPQVTDGLREAHVEALEYAASRIVLALEDRDHAIREAYRDGLSSPVIAEAVGLTRQRVWQILRAS